LDAAAYGVNIVEREGISLIHPANFILVGTMNPAEGELRPQLSDRIGLHISVHSIMELEDRVEIMQRREEFESNPNIFRDKFKNKQDEIQHKIIKARKILKEVKIPRDLLEVIAKICIDMGVDGHRADIAILKTSKAIAAYNNRNTVNEDDVSEAALLVLGERFQKASYDQDKIKKKVEEAISEVSEDKKEKQKKTPIPESGDTKKRGMKLKTLEKEDELVEADEEEVDIKKLLKMKGKKKRRLYGKRVNSQTLKGRYIKSKIPRDNSNDIAIDATIRAAALGSKGNIKVEKKTNRVKGILNRIIEDTNRHQDKLSVIGFKGEEAEIIIPTTRRALSFQEQVDNIRVGGTTPLASGLKKGFELLKKEKAHNEYVPMMIILTDGMPNVGLDEGPVQDAIKIAEKLKNFEILTITVNFEKAVKFGHEFNMDLALASGGRYYDVEDLKDPACAISNILDYERSQL
jgi:magnesium chelatase subunit D